MVKERDGRAGERARLQDKREEDKTNEKDSKQRGREMTNERFRE